MSNIPIGIQFTESGQTKVLGSLKAIEKGTSKIRASTVALGNISGAAVIGAFKKIGQAVSSTIKEGAELAAMAREGKEVSSAFSDSGLAAAESVAAQFKAAADGAKAWLINSLPTIQVAAKSAWEQLKYLGVGTAKSVANFFSMLPESLQTVKDNAAILLDWFSNNWRSLASNLGKGLIAAFTNSFENLKRLIEAAKRWIKGDGWEFEAKGLTEGADFKKIEGPAFKSFAFITENNKVWEALAQDKAKALDRISEEYATLTSTKVRGEGAKDKDKGKEPKLAEALTRGSVAAVQAINKSKVDASTEIAKRQLTEAQKQTALLAQMRSSLDLTPIPI